jgi:hypothetical protein
LAVAAAVPLTLLLLVSVDVSVLAACTGALAAGAAAAAVAAGAEDDPLEAACAALMCGGVSTSSMRGLSTISSVVNWNSSGARGEPSGMVVPGWRSSSKNGCSHA